MYGWLLESVQHFIVQECGEEIWETILREAGARNTVFSATQQYPDALMLRLACALARFLNKDPNSPATSTPASPAPRKQSFKSKPSWRSSSVHTDNRSAGFKCPFTATNVLTAATKKEIEAYNSSEQIAAHTLSADRINERDEIETNKQSAKEYNRRSLDIQLEDNRTEDKPETSVEKVTTTPVVDKGEHHEEIPKDSEPTSPCSSNSESTKKNSILKPIAIRKSSCTLALDVYRRRGSGAVPRPRMNSLNLVPGDKIVTMREKFGTPEKVMHFFGRCFVKFFSNYGYDTMVRATGRYFCTFLQSVDSIHQRMRFTFPRMRSPSMQLTRAHRHGAELVYSSTRTGFTHYLMGQLYEIAEDIFSLKLKVSVVKESMEGTYYVAVLRLEFDNSDYVQSLMLRKSLPCPLPAVPASLLLQLFPFGVLLDRKMKIISAGEKLIAAWGGPYDRMEKQPITEILRLRKPKISFTWDKVVCMQTMLFELELMRWRARIAGDARRGSQGARAVLFKGPIYLLEEIDALIFLCSPIFNDLDELRQAGLYLADMNCHGLSKEMLLQGWQHLSRLELLFEKAESRCLSLEKSCRLLDQWKKRGDQLLYSMIPKAVADHLRSGKDPMAACQAFESVTILFCGVQLAQAGTRAGVMQTVAYINDVYSRIDRMLDSHRVYKMSSFIPITLVGDNLGLRQRHLNSLVAQAYQQGVSLQSIQFLTEHSPIDRLFKIDLASKCRHEEYIIQNLKDEDMLYVSRALKSTWLLETEYTNLINPRHLEGQLYPEMTTTAVHKMKHWLTLNLKDSKRCEEFFEYYQEKDFHLAIKFLYHCSKEYIVTKVTGIVEKLTPRYLKLLSETCPEATKIFYDSIHQADETVLSNYSKQDSRYFGNLKYLRKSDPNIFLDILEKYFDKVNFDTIGRNGTKYVMKYYKHRFVNKPEVYTTWILDGNTLALYLNKDEIKEVILKIASAKYLDWMILYYQRYEPLIKRLPFEEREEFKKQVFKHKSIGPLIEEWPYDPPSRPVRKSSVVVKFQDKNEDTTVYNILGVGYDCKRCDLMWTRSFKDKDITLRSRRQIITNLQKLFDRYRFNSFDETFTELQPKITLGSLKARQDIMLVLVSKSGGRATSVEILLKLLTEQHENEAVHIRAAVVRSLVKRCNSWRLPQPTWDLLLRFGKDLGLDGKPSDVHCIEGLHAVVLRNLVLDHPCNPEVWNSFLKNFSTLIRYALTKPERQVVLNKLPQLLLSEAEADPSKVLQLHHLLLDTLDAYKIPADKYTDLVAAIIASNDKPLMLRLFKDRNIRKKYFAKYFRIIQTDATYFKALKHDTDILSSGEDFLDLLESGKVKLGRFLRALSIYFGEPNGLAEQYFHVLEKHILDSPGKSLARPLSLLAGVKLLPIIQNLNSQVNKMKYKYLSAALKANAHLSKPLINLDDIGYETISVKAIANRVFTCSAMDAESCIAKLLSCKRTQKLALVLSMRIGKEHSVFASVAATSPKLALKTALWHAQRGHKLDERTWDIILPLIARLVTQKNLGHKLRTALVQVSTVSMVPTNKRSEFCATVITIYKNIPGDATTALLYYIKINLPDFDEKIIETIINEFLDEEFIEENVLKWNEDIFKKRALQYVRIIAKYMLLGKCERTLNDRLVIGKRFIDRIQALWINAKKSDIMEYFNKFIYCLKNTEIFFDAEYISCVRVFECVLNSMESFLSKESYFSKYIEVRLTMLYYISVRECLENNPEYFKDLPQKIEEIIEVIGIVFGKRMGAEIYEMKAAYFESVLDIYRRVLPEYMDKYFNKFIVDRKLQPWWNLFVKSIITGWLDSDHSVRFLAKYVVNYHVCSCTQIEIFDILKQDQSQEVRFFLDSEFDTDTPDFPNYVMI